MKEHYHKWYSQYLSRDFEMLVFGHAGIPIILFPTSHGRYYENKDQGLIESVSEFIKEGLVTVFCPDGIDAESWEDYNAHPSVRVQMHILYERLILNDVIGFAKYQTGAKSVGLAGCSFGGYHSSNIAFRYPNLISSLITMGGTFDIKPFIYGYYDDDCYFNCPLDYMPNLTDPWYIEKMKEMKIILGTGENDFCLDENRKFSEILYTKDINHKLDITNGAGHDWPWWKEMFPAYLGEVLEIN
jgi:esterase/lipase superfamily enzyme